MRQTGQRSEQPEFAQSPPQFLRHVRAMILPKTKIGRPVGLGQIAPALKGPARPRDDRDDLRLEFEAAAPDAVRIDEGFDASQALPRRDPTFDDPIERASVQKFGTALRSHPRDVPGQLRFATQPPCENPLCDESFKIADRLSADAEFDEVKRHPASLASRRRLANAA
jgi:hypothetical protein